MTGLNPSATSWRSRVAAASSLSFGGRRQLAGVLPDQAELADRALQPGRRGVVERLVPPAADVVGEPDLEPGGVGLRQGRRRARCRTGRSGRRVARALACRPRRPRHHRRPRAHRCPGRSPPPPARWRAPLPPARSLVCSALPRLPFRPARFFRSGRRRDGNRAHRRPRVQLRSRDRIVGLPVPDRRVVDGRRHGRDCGGGAARSATALGAALLAVLLLLAGSGAAPAAVAAGCPSGQVPPPPPALEETAPGAVVPAPLAWPVPPVGGIALGCLWRRRRPRRSRPCPPR